MSVVASSSWLTVWHNHQGAMDKEVGPSQPVVYLKLPINRNGFVDPPNVGISSRATGPSTNKPTR